MPKPQKSYTAIEGSSLRSVDGNRYWVVPGPVVPVNLQGRALGNVENRGRTDRLSASS